jgi:DNA-binding NarL/FixJ family response regulator
MEIQSNEGMKIYLVEDSHLIRSRLSSMLEEIDGVEIVGEAEDAGSAVVGIAATRPDVIVLDLQLAGGSGLDVLRELKNIAPGVVSIVLTNYALPQFRKQCMAAGAQHFFDKTAEFSKVTETIAQLSPH